VEIIADIYERWGGQGCLTLAIIVVLGAWTIRWAIG
jgi:hypothetical protein